MYTYIYIYMQHICNKINLIYPAMQLILVAWSCREENLQQAAVREAGVSRHHGAQFRAPLKALEHHGRV